MTDTFWIHLITAAYFIGIGTLGFYLLWSEWQWMRKEADYEKRTLQDDTTHD